MLRLRINIVTLAGDAHRAIGGDFPAAGIRHAGFDAIFIILTRIARRLERERCLARGIGLDGFAFDDLTSAVVTATPAVAWRKIVIQPRIIMRMTPVMIIRVLINDQFHAGIADRPAEIIIRLNADFHFFAEAKSFLAAILLGSLHGHFEFRQFVFFEPEERGVADLPRSALVPKSHMEFAQRQVRIQLQRTPRGAEGVERGLVFHDLHAARIVNLELHHLILRSDIRRAGLFLTRDKFPSHRLARAISRPVGESINPPAFVTVGIAVIEITISIAESLAVLRNRAGI